MFYFLETDRREQKKVWNKTQTSVDNTVREHRQKSFVMLSGFWLLRGWRRGGRGWVNPLKKLKFVTRIFSLYIVEWSSKYLCKIMSADVKANIKQ